MAHYAIIDENNIVKNVLYVDNQFALDENGDDNEESSILRCRESLGDYTSTIIRTSINGNIRGTYSGIGYTYDSENDVFIPPQKFKSWILNNETFLWEPPIPMPEPIPGKLPYWDDENVKWEFISDPAYLITEFKFRNQLTVSEKLLWDNPDIASTPTQKAVINTFKSELPLDPNEQNTTELLGLLVSEGVYTQERLDEIISNL